MIRINYSGRHGNNLFQYFTGIILSEINNQNIVNPFNTKIIKSKSKPQNDYTNTIHVNDDNIDDIIKNNINNSNIELTGFFQKESVIDLFDEYYSFLNNTKSYEDGVFVHVRLGDLLGDPPGRWANQDYYETILDSIQFNNGFISSDSLDHPIVENLIKKYDLKIFKSNEDDLILFGSSFKYKILSLGTFSWWMGYMGCQENVFFPNPNKYLKWFGNILVKNNWNLI